MMSLSNFPQRIMSLDPIDVTSSVRSREEDLQQLNTCSMYVESSGIVVLQRLHSLSPKVGLVR